MLLASWALASAAPAAAAPRDALIARWLAANPQMKLPAGTVPVVAPPRRLRALAARELSSGYRLTAAVAPPQRQPWWQRAWRWADDRWTQLWRAAFGRARLGRRGAVAIGDVLLAAAIAIVAFALWRLLAAMLFARSPAPPRETLEPHAEPAALYAAACERARRGEYASASRLLFGATVARLAQRGVVLEDRSATVGELRRAVRRRDDALVGPFDAVSSAFETGAYAELPVDLPLWEGARRGFLALDDGEPA